VKTLAHADDLAEIRRRLKGVRADRRALWGRMSAHQMVCHLSDAFLAVTGEKQVSAATGLLQRTLVKWFALYAPLRWMRGYPTRPELDQSLGGTRPAGFAEDLARLESLVERVAAEGRGFQWHPHPVFGPLTDAQWLRWSYLHLDHHLRQFGS
jgi:hypothetical protein